MFLEKLLPPEGMYCVAQLLPGGGFKHFFFNTLEAARMQLSVSDAAGHTVYIAQASFTPQKIKDAQTHNRALPFGAAKTERRKERSQENAHHIKNFFLDIDVGDKWPLKSQREAADELKKFVADTGLPFPAVVSSGNGLYAHWILDTAVPAMQWKTIAGILKRVVAEYSPALGGDASRTSDSASVLRVPGTTNRKPGREPKQVLLLRDAEPVPFLTFVELLNSAAQKRKVQHTAALPPVAVKDINAEFSTMQEIVSDPHKVASKCAQLGAMRDTRGDISEPLWYACIGVLIFCCGGDDVVQRWSSGHPDYSYGETTAKIQQWRNTGLGPATCANLGEKAPAGCIGCPHNGKIKSPIVLGRPDPELLPLPDMQCPPPDGFRRGEDGLYAEEEGRWVRFYDCDLYPDNLAYDMSLGYEVTTIKHKLPHEGELECTIRSSIVNDPKALLTLLSDNHIKVVGVKEKKFMVAYLESYQARLQRARRMSMLLCQMGWADTRKNTPMFVLGRTIFHADGTAEDASLARNVPSAAAGFRTEGSLDAWVRATEVLGQPGMEPHAFALLASFGAPLMRFTGFEGAVVSMVGDSGSGKTLMAKMGASVWGYHKDLVMLKGDTANGLMARLGTYGTLPLAIDEVTNLVGISLSDTIYQITQGREKVRLTRNATEKANINRWNTIAITTSNAALTDKLSELKQDASAELNRIFEYPVMQQACFQGDVTEDLYWAITENYGHAGMIYARWLAQNVDAVKRALVMVKDTVELQAEIKGEERFWCAVVSASILGGKIAHKLGLLKFDIGDVQRWAVATIEALRGDKKALVNDAMGILGQFLDEHAGNRLLVTGKPNSAGWAMVELPHGKLVYRYELDTKRVFIARDVFKMWLAKRYGSYSHVRNELKARGALIESSRRKTLGSGTVYATAPQMCWELDMNCKELQDLAHDVIRVAKMLAKAPIAPSAEGGES